MGERIKFFAVVMFLMVSCIVIAHQRDVAKDKLRATCAALDSIGKPMTECGWQHNVIQVIDGGWTRPKVSP